MKKGFGIFLAVLAGIMMTAALTLPIFDLTAYGFRHGNLSFLKPIFELKPWQALCVLAAVTAGIVGLGTLINCFCRKAKAFLGAFCGFAAFFTLFGIVLWGEMQGRTLLFAAVFPELLTKNGSLLTEKSCYYFAAAIMAVALILAAISKRLYRSGTFKKIADDEVGQIRSASRATTTLDTPYSADVSAASYATSKSPKTERFVRDPWGNLIKEDEYNERVRQAKEKPL